MSQKVRMNYQNGNAKLFLNLKTGKHKNLTNNHQHIRNLSSMLIYDKQMSKSLEFEPHQQKLTINQMFITKIWMHEIQ